tara:strand:+ start:1279 stop:1422 length:144 start_codon:yes stop_codon:yes gene_type:complete
MLNTYSIPFYLLLSFISKNLILKRFSSSAVRLPTYTGNGQKWPFFAI